MLVSKDRRWVVLGGERVQVARIAHYGGGPKRLIVHMEDGAILHEQCDVAELDRVIGLGPGDADDGGPFDFAPPDHPDD